MMRPFAAGLLSLILIGSTVAAEPTFHGKTFAEWKTQLEKGTSQERGRAAMALGLGPFGKKAVPLLVNALQEKDPHARRCAIVALRELGSDAEPAIAALAVLLHKSEEEQYSAVCMALGNIGSAAIPVLLAAAATAESEIERSRIALALQHIGKPALPALEKVLLEGEQRELAASVICRLDDGAAPALSSLIRALASREPGVRSNVLETLARLGPKAEPALPVLLKRLEDKEDRHGAAQALVAIGKPAWPALRRVLDKGSPAVRRVVLYCLRPDWDEALPRLLDELKKGDEATKDAVGQALARFGLDLPDRLPLTRDFLTNPDPLVRATIYGSCFQCERLVCDEAFCVAALALLDPSTDITGLHFAFHYLERIPESVLSVYLTALKDRRPEVRARSANRLGRQQFDNPAVEIALCEALRDEEETVRAAAAFALGRLGPRTRRIAEVHASRVVDRVVIALQARLHDGDERVRASAAIALCRVGYPTDALVRQAARLMTELHALTDEAGRALLECADLAAAAIPILIKGLEHSDFRVRQQIARTLGSLGPVARAAVPALTLAMKDHDTRTEAILALSRIGPAGISVLVRVLEGQSAEDKHEVFWALLHQTAGAAKLAPAVEKLLGDPDAKLRESAKDFLLEHEAFSEPLRKALTDDLQSENSQSRFRASWRLRYFRSKAAASIPALKLSLLDTGADVRSYAVGSLAAIDPTGKVVLPSLLDALTDREEVVRQLTVIALGDMGPPANAGLAGIREALKDRAESVRIEAALALWRISGREEEAMLALKALQRDSRSSLRVEAIEYMRQIEKKREQLDMLARLIGEEDQTTRGRAAGVLIEIGEEARVVLPAIAVWTKHPSVAIRRDAFWVQYELTRKPTGKRSWPQE
jgi:HEAT repeat protein